MRTVRVCGSLLGLAAYALDRFHRRVELSLEVAEFIRPRRHRKDDSRRGFLSDGLYLDPLLPGAQYVRYANAS